MVKTHKAAISVNIFVCRVRWVCDVCDLMVDFELILHNDLISLVCDSNLNIFMQSVFNFSYFCQIQLYDVECRLKFYRNFYMNQLTKMFLVSMTFSVFFFCWMFVDLIWFNHVNIFVGQFLRGFSCFSSKNTS